ncbi:MAG: anti-sigma F factor [Clostridia bacterium]|nr:anti-sigma F factor [Clostridia bacterium]
MKETINQMELKIKALSVNESFVRATLSGFCLQLNPTIDELTDVKTAVSEAVTNSIVHAYPQGEVGDILIKATLYKDTIQIEILDFGIGINNLEEAKKPFYTTKPNQERSGMGFTVMESFMDTVEVSNNETGGLRVLLIKKFDLTNNQKVKTML